MKTVLCAVEEFASVKEFKEKAKQGETLRLKSGATLKLCINENMNNARELHLITGGSIKTNYSCVYVAEPSGEGITSLNQDQTQEALETGKFTTMTRGGKVFITGHLVNIDGSTYKPNSVKFEDGGIGAKVKCVIDDVKIVGAIPEKDEGLARVQIDF